MTDFPQRIERVDPLARPANSAGPESPGGAGIGALVARLAFRVGQLERRLLGLTGTPARPPRFEYPDWSQPGAVTAVTGVEHDVRAIGVVVQMVARLTTAGTTTTTAELFKNGSSVGTVSLTSGQTRVVVGLSTPVAPGDGLRPDITAAGTGAVGFSLGLTIAG